MEILVQIDVFAFKDVFYSKHIGWVAFVCSVASLNIFKVDWMK